MFDIGFTEIILVFVVILLVAGPERLPRMARTAGLWLGRMRGFMTSVKADIDRELATEELKKALAKQAKVAELEELVDEVSGKPLEAVESGGPKLQAEQDTDGQPQENNSGSAGHEQRK